MSQGESAPKLIPKYLRYIDELPTSSIDKYTIIKKLARGAFGAIYEARLAADDDETGQRFAVKKKLSDHIKRGTGITNHERQEAHALRCLGKEINIVRLIEIVREPNNLSIVMSLAKTDLHKIIRLRSLPINEDEIKIILNQFIKGLKAIHSLNFIHRDIKPSNILLTSEGIIQIADFGMSIQLESGAAQRKKMNSRVGTGFYKAPELLLGDEMYDRKIDSWGLGCVASELWSRQVLFRGMDKAAQVKVIASICGYPDEVSWPRATTLKHYNDYQQAYGSLKNNHLHYNLLKITNGNAPAANLLLKLLRMNPEERLEASDALNHELFSSSPVGTDVKSLVDKYCSAVNLLAAVDEHPIKKSSDGDESNNQQE